MLKDIEMAKKLMLEEGLKICVVKNQKVVYKSMKRGILPMYELATNHLHELQGASLADRVVGRAAALLNGYIKVAAVYTEVISENALEILKRHKIECSYESLVSGIQNREKNDACPIEKISSKVNDHEVEDLILKIKDFLSSIKAL